MWNLIPRKLMPPTRIVRYCCAVLGIVNGAIDGIEHRNAVLLVCYDRGEWWLFDRPSIDANVYRWMPLPEPPEKELYG